MNASSLTRHLLCLVLLVAGGLSAAGQEIRTWTDATGKFKIEGKFKQLEDGKVTLERKDGSLVEIDVKKLSADDQKLIEEQAANPFKPAADNPFKPKTTEPRNPFEPGSSSSSSGSGGAKEVTPNFGSAETVAMMPSQSEWKLAAPAAPPAETGSLKARSIPLPPKTDFFEGAKGIVLNHSGQRAVIGYILAERGGRNASGGQTRIVACDVASGKMLMTATEPTQMTPIALHDKGAQVLMVRDEWGFGNHDYLELWNLAPTGVTKALRWAPYGDQKGGERDVKWAAFLDEERLATLGGGGKLVVWTAATAQPLFSLQIDGGCIPALSRDRKYLAFATGKQVGVLDLAAKEVVALQPTQQLAWPKLCFSPDGARLACLAHDRLYVWNFTDGTLYREVPLSGMNIPTGEMLWPHERYLLLGKQMLFDIENQVKVWTYTGHELVEQAGPMTAFVVNQGQDKPGALVLTKIPAPTFEQTLAKAMQDPDFFVLKPGTTVRLDLDGLPDPAEREKVRDTLTKKLTDRGFKTGASGTITLTASAEAGEERDVSYHGFGSLGFRSYKVREYHTKLAFVYQGKTVWQTQGSSVPGFIQLKEGETMEQVLRRSEKPNYAVYEHVELPKMLMKPTSGDGLGSSQVSVAGVQ